MKKYIIVRDAVPSNVEDEVSERLNDNWECQGGVSADDHYFMQAMIKDEPDPTPKTSIKTSD